MSSRLSFAHVLHNIWTKIIASYVQNKWEFQAFVIDCLPHTALLHFHLPTPRVSIPFYQDSWILVFCSSFTKQGKKRAKSGVREAYMSNMHFPSFWQTPHVLSIPKENKSIIVITLHELVFQ